MENMEIATDMGMGDGERGSMERTWQSIRIEM